MDSGQIFLGDRYINDAKPLLPLNALQEKMKSQIESKFQTHKYVFEQADCIVCGSRDFLRLAEKERYGLYCPTAICKKCGLVQASPRMRQKDYFEFYNLEYRMLYEATKEPTEQFFALQYSRAAQICAYIEKATGWKIEGKFVAEIGTGAGGILQYFKEKGNEVYGLDIGRQYLKFGASKGLWLEAGGMEKLETLDRKPDIVIYSHVAEHLLDPVAEFRKLKKFLAKGGFLFLEVPGIKDLHLRTGHGYRSDFLKALQTAHTYYFTLTSLRNCLQKAGYKMVAGNETICSVFAPAKAGAAAESGFESDYSATIAFLREAESARSGLINMPVLKLKAFGAITSALKVSGAYGFAQGLRKNPALSGPLGRIMDFFYK